MSFRRLTVVAVLLLGAVLLVGCGDSLPTNTAPTEKQKEKEKMKPGPGPGGPKTK
ncbi:MAG: hypothetical protein L0241_32400 [Planctomycetia bacterium]|nr:hypothetical protein [Planctomycetia bacterium]